MSITEFAYDDCLYGNVRFGEEITQLIIQPLVQRLRQIRLSNIDSLSMPAIGGVSRVLSTLWQAHLASDRREFGTISRDDQILIQAAALITRITPQHLSGISSRRLSAMQMLASITKQMGPFCLQELTILRLEA